MGFKVESELELLLFLLLLLLVGCWLLVICCWLVVVVVDAKNSNVVYYLLSFFFRVEFINGTALACIEFLQLPVANIFARPCDHTIAVFLHH